MIPCIRVKQGVDFGCPAASGFRILAALERTARDIGHDITITSACDGAHSGPDDPHHEGKAYDIRSKDLRKNEALMMLLTNLREGADDAVTPKDGGYASRYFFAWIEAADTANEHIHVQQRRDTIYPPLVTNREEVESAANAD